MNIKHILVSAILLMFTCSLLIAQETRTHTINTNLEFEHPISISTQSGTFLVPTLGLSLNNHFITVGYKLNRVSPFEGERGGGCQLAYKIFPNGRDNFFNMYFGLNADYYQYHIVNKQPLFNNTIPKDIYLVETTLGYGFHFNPAKKFFLRFEAAYGIANIIRTHFDWEPAYYFDNTLLFQISLGFRLIKD